MHGVGRLGPWLAALLLAAPAAAQDAVEIRTVDVAPGLHLLIGRGGNIGVSTGSDGVLLIDDQFADLSEKIRAAVGRISKAPLRLLLNTHWHGDHTGGNESLAGLGVLIFAHDAVRTRMSAEQYMAAMGRRVPASPPAARPVVTFGADLSFHWNGDTIHAIHVPSAHTDGDAIVHFQRANAIHTGDLFFAGRFPFVDLSSGGSIDGLIDGVDRVLALADEATAILPGHGELSTRADLQRYRDMLAAARERVAAEIAAGRDADAAVAAAPLAGLDGEWGGGFVDAEAFVRALHASLSAR